MKIAGVTDYSNQTPSKHFTENYSYVQDPKNDQKKSFNVYKIIGAYFQCVNDHYTKFEYKRIKTVGVTDNTNQTHLRILMEKNV